MQINTLGLVAALSAFLGIWAGHVTVRKVEYISQSIHPPVMIFIALGLSVEYVSLTVDLPRLKVALGIFGVTLLWDALEVVRQQGRVRRGHAPANPHNPRHAAILAQPNSRATTADLLDREPGEICLTQE